MKIVDHDNPAYLSLVSDILSRCCLTDEQFDEFRLYDDLLYDFTRLKRDCHQRATRCGYDIISLGENCLPHTLCVRWGLIPTLDQDPARGRLPFDLCYNDPMYIFDILSTSFHDYCADSISPMQSDPNGTRYFTNSKYGTTFNHDFIDNNISKEENINIINKKLKERIVNFDRICKSENKVFVIFYEHFLPSDVMSKLDSFIRKNYNSSLLIIYNNSELPSSFDNMLLTSYPGKNYVWYKVNSWYTDAGFDFEYRVINFILESLESYKVKESRPLRFNPSPPPPRVWNQFKLYVRVANYYCDIGERRQAGKFLMKALKFTEGYKPELWHLTNKRIINGC